MKIAILGASGHVGRNLAVAFSCSDDCEVSLFSRKPSQLKLELGAVNNSMRFLETRSFGADSFDAVINCTGVGDPRTLKESPLEVLRVTEEFDHIVTNFVVAFPKTKVISLSSGIVYGTGFRQPVREESEVSFRLGDLSSYNPYRVAKIVSEAKHRMMSDYFFVDLRLFSFFSQYADLNEPYFVNEMIRCLIQGRELETSSEDMVRDYVHPDDLYELVRKVLTLDFRNGPLDVYSKASVSKQEILNFFVQKHRLKLRQDDLQGSNSPTGSKSVYYSENHAAAEIGYRPRFNSLETINDQYLNLKQTSEKSYLARPVEKSIN